MAKVRNYRAIIIVKISVASIKLRLCS